jgi:hypothetical protein
VGTSRPLRGPTEGYWPTARRRVKEWMGEPTADVTQPGEACQRALRETLRDDPDAFGLRVALEEAGERLVQVLDDLKNEGPSAIGVDAEGDPDDRIVEFEVRFTERVAGTGNLVVDTAVRRAAARAAIRIAGGDEPAARAVRSGADGGLPISGDLFCDIYRFFFGEVVGEFLTTAISAKLQLMFPAVHLMPFGTGPVLTGWIAKKIVGALPSPCEEKEEPEHFGDSLADLGRKLLGQVVRQSLGLDTPEAEAAA